MGSSSSGQKAQAQAQTQAAQIQADAAVQVAQDQAAATVQAAELGLQGSQMIAGASHAAAAATAGATAHAANLQRESAREALEEQRRQFNQIRTDFEPYRELGTAVIPEIQNAATLEGFAQRLSDIMDTDIFADLQSERFQAADARLSAAGLNRSGSAAQAASDITADLALGLDASLYGRQLNNLNIGQSATAFTGNAGQNFANQAGSILTGSARDIGNTIQTGAVQQGNFLIQGAQAGAAGLNAVGQGIVNSAAHIGSGIMGAANATAQGVVGSANALAGGGGANFGGALSGAAAGAQVGSVTGVGAGIGAVVGGVLGFFSDETLKENMEKVGQVHDLTLYEWDWREDVKPLVGAEMNLGFSAQEVERKYPDCVLTAANDKKVINYPRLLKILEQKPMRLAA